MTAYSRAVDFLKAQGATQNRILYPWEWLGVQAIQLNPLQDDSAKTPLIVRRLTEWRVWARVNSTLPAENSQSAAGFPQFNYSLLWGNVRSWFAGNSSVKPETDFSGIIIIAGVAAAVIFLMKKGK